MLKDVCGSLSKIWKITHAISFLNTRIFNPVNVVYIQYVYIQPCIYSV